MFDGKKDYRTKYKLGSYLIFQSCYMCVYMYVCIHVCIHVCMYKHALLTKVLIMNIFGHEFIGDFYQPFPTILVVP